MIMLKNLLLLHFKSPISINWNDEDNINLDGSIEKTPLEEEFEGFEFLQEITTTTNNNNNSTSNDKTNTARLF